VPVTDGTEVAREAKRVVVLSFTGRFHQHGGKVFATCDHAALVTHGADEDEALDRMEGAIEIYVRTLDARGELDLALRSGKLQVSFADMQQDWAAPRLSKVDSGFVAQLATV
jgi:hypothetical protein